MEYFSPDAVFLLPHSKGVFSVQDNFYLHWRHLCETPVSQGFFGVRWDKKGGQSSRMNTTTWLCSNSFISKRKTLLIGPFDNPKHLKNLPKLHTYQRATSFRFYTRDFLTRRHSEYCKWSPSLCWGELGRQEVPGATASSLIRKGGTVPGQHLFIGYIYFRKAALFYFCLARI